MGIRERKPVSPDFDVAVKRHPTAGRDSEGVGHRAQPGSVAAIVQLFGSVAVVTTCSSGGVESLAEPAAETTLSDWLVLS